VPSRQGRHGEESRRKFSTKLAVALVTGFFTLSGATISAYAVVHASEIGEYPSAHSTYTPAAAGKPRMPPSAPRSSPPGTAANSSYPVTPIHPPALPSHPTPTAIPPNSAPAPRPRPTTAPPTATGQSNISAQIYVVGYCVNDICLPQSLTLQPVVQENGAPVIGNCEINWTILEEGSIIFQSSSSCQDRFSTGLVLVAGNYYEIFAEVITDSGVQTQHLGIYVENGPQDFEHVLCQLSILCPNYSG
jgi:hypothetical protein